MDKEGEDRERVARRDARRDHMSREEMRISRLPLNESRNVIIEEVIENLRLQNLQGARTSAPSLRTINVHLPLRTSSENSTDRSRNQPTTPSSRDANFTLRNSDQNTENATNSDEDLPPTYAECMRSG